MWDLERPKPRGGIAADKEYLKRKRFDEIWVSDAQLARDLQARFVVLGSDERLGHKPKWFKRFGFTHISYENGRRATVYEQLDRIGPNSWGSQRDKILRQTKFGLTVHQDNDLYTEPLRLAIFSAYNLPVISETITDAFPISDYLLTADYEYIAEFSKSCLKQYRQLKDLGNELTQKLCFDYKFKHMVEYAVRN